jgi:EpsI family protein
MTAGRRRAFVALGLMVASAVGAAAWKPRQVLADQRAKIDLQTLFPVSFGEWKVDTRMPAQLISPDQAAVLNAIYSQTLSRTYVNPKGDRVMLSVAYGGDQSDATRAHRPEVCYPAQGFQILAMNEGHVAAAGQQLEVRRLETRLGARIEPLTYWIVVGEKVAISGTQQKLAQLKYGFAGLIPDGMLVRVSTIDADSRRAFGVQDRFVAELVATLPPQTRSRVVGSGDGRASAS